jgi:hypothetical protein
MGVERSGVERADQAPSRSCRADLRVLGDRPSGISHLSVTGLIMGLRSPSLIQGRTVLFAGEIAARRARGHGHRPAS